MNRDELPHTSRPVLQEAETQVLTRVWQCFAGQPFDDAELSALSVPPLSGAEVLAAVTGLVRSGELHSAPKAWGERWFYIPENHLAALQEQFYELPPEIYAAAEPALKQEAAPGLPRDVLQALLFLHQEGGLELTARGTIHKRQLQKLNRLKTGLQPEHVYALGVSDQHPDLYPPVAAVLLDLLLTLGLVREQAGSLRLDSKAVRAWLALPEESMHALIFQQVLNRYGAPSVPLQHFRRLLCCSKLSPHAWIKGDVLVASIAGFQAKPAAVESVTAGAQAWMDFMAAAGWADIGQCEQGRPWLSLRLPGHALLSPPRGPIDESSLSIQPCLYVQPDGDILVLPDAPLSVHWDVARCAERLSEDRITTYRLTRESLQTAARQGYSAGEMLNGLTRYSLSGIPESVADAVQLWGQSDVAASPESSADREKLHCSEAAGQSAAPEQAGITKNLHTRGFALQKGLIHHDHLVERLEPDFNVPDVDALFPGLKDIPRSWTRELRSYHRSTAEKLMETALGWRMALELGAAESVVRFIPLQHEPAPWKMAGLLYEQESAAPRRVVLGAEDWPRLRILLPLSCE
ncbi:helicase-associated domain-containing protein [Paenibacillus sp. JSM ZJ436]|uniref:helicase-associated domain-containing protein n=1 Tax=Paenibacillus sp. JSM ZJ436 TaxID=3376190 RepID=UPI00379D26AF